MKKILILASNSLGSDLESKITSSGNSFNYITDETLVNGECDYSYNAIIHGGDTFLSEKILSNFPNLELVAFSGAGYTAFLDADYCRTNDIAVSNTPSANADSVAELAIGLMVDIKRRISFFNQNLKQGGELEKLSHATDIKSSVIGIAGMGSIGGRIANICSKGFGAEVIYTSRTKKDNDFKFVSKEELLKESDVLFLCMSGIDENSDYITSKELKIMKKSAFIVNPAIPYLINGNDLYEALSNNEIAGCAIDRCYSDKLECSSEDACNHNLLSLPDNLLLNTPSIGDKTQSAWDNMDTMSVENVVNFFQGKKELVHLV